MAEKGYQKGFFESYASSTYDTKVRGQKAEKILAVLDDYYAGDLKDQIVLDLGCSTGLITSILGKKFKRIVGADIDIHAIRSSAKKQVRENLSFMIQDGLNLGFIDESFDIVICAHIYEHVPNPQKLMSEIYRVLKPEGVCYFAVENRLLVIEPHYKLPFLSLIPKKLAHLYLRVFRKEHFYYENLLTVWGLRKLVEDFRIIDYTQRIVEEPGLFHATDMLNPNSLKQKISKFVLQKFYWLCPTYIWLLKKGK
ncbi:methyltransferase domain-containing protein [Candidatus Altiarchaeota archaeon]